MLLFLLLMTSMNKSCNRASRVGFDLWIIFSSAVRPLNLSFIKTLLVCSTDTLSCVTCVFSGFLHSHLNSKSFCWFPVYFTLDVPFMLVTLVDHWWCPSLPCVFYSSSH
jgi:hypothetical protein